MSTLFLAPDRPRLGATPWGAPAFDIDALDAMAERCNRENPTEYVVCPTRHEDFAERGAVLWEVLGPQTGRTGRDGQPLRLPVMMPQGGQDRVYMPEVAARDFAAAMNLGRLVRQQRGEV